MKTIYVLVLTVLMSYSIGNGQEIKWNSWNEGYQLAKKENKPILLFVYAKWCDQCKRMETKTFKNEEVVSLVDKGYIPIKLDIDVAMKGNDIYKKDGIDLKGMELLKTLVPPGPLGIPLNIIFTSGSETKVMISGLKDFEEMIELLTANTKK
jgi:uncharacterized protein YyaL (SSP411 family)